MGAAKLTPQAYNKKRLSLYGDSLFSDNKIIFRKELKSIISDIYIARYRIGLY